METEAFIGGYVLDSSVIIKWFTTEEDSAKALLFRQGDIKGVVELAEPDLLLYELANALRYNQVLSENDVHNAVQRLCCKFHSEHLTSILWVKHFA